MTSLWPWLAVAGMGALHGLNPATGWGLAAAWGVRSRDRSLALRALAPLAAGHAASVVLVAGLVAASIEVGMIVEPVVLQVAAGAVFAGMAVLRMPGWRRCHHPGPSMAGKGMKTGLAFWSFIMSTVHGTGLMLVPALTSLCMGEGAVREVTASGTLATGLAAVCVHMAAMLAVTGAMAAGMCQLFSAGCSSR